MFPWDRKSETNFRAKKNYHRASSNETPHPRPNIPDPDLKNHTVEHLPRIKHYHKPHGERDASFQGHSLNGKQDFYNYNRNDNSHSFGRSHNPRSHSYTPMEEKIFKANEEQKKNYAKILEDQIQAAKMQKAHEKLRALEIDKKMMNGNDFYRHFDSKFDERFMEKTSVTITENSPSKYVKSLAKKGQTEGGISIVPQPARTSPLKALGERYSANQSVLKEEYHEEDDPFVNEKTLAYIKKLEYKKELEQQIIEQNLRKKHEKEMRALEEKLEEMKYSYTRLKTKTAQEEPNQKSANHSFEKSPPPKVKGSGAFEVLVKQPMEPVKAEKPDPTARRPSFVRKVVPPIVPAETKILGEVGAGSRLKPFVPTVEKSMMDIRSESSSPERQNVSYQQKTDGGLWNYMQIQTELGRMRTEFKDYMRGINDKISSLKSEFSGNFGLNDSENYKNKEFLHFQVIKEYPRLIATPFNINPPAAALQVPSSMGLSTNESKQSLVHDTQFVPLNESLNKPPLKQLAPTASNVSTSRISTVSSSKSNNKMTEYGPLLDNMVNLTKKLEESVSNQQQKITKEMGSVREELQTLKKAEDREHDRELKGVTRQKEMGSAREELQAVRKSEDREQELQDKELKAVTKQKADQEMRSSVREEVQKAEKPAEREHDREFKSGANKSPEIKPQVPKRTEEVKALNREMDMIQEDFKQLRESEERQQKTFSKSKSKELEPPKVFTHEAGPKILIYEAEASPVQVYEEQPSFSPQTSQQTSNENSMIADESRQKIRRKSLNITNVTKGIKRNREEMLAETRKKA